LGTLKPKKEETTKKYWNFFSIFVLEFYFAFIRMNNFNFLKS